MKLILIGPPGSGKGTQAARLKERFAIPHLSSGEILRAEVSAGTDLGLLIDGYMKKGEIGPAELITKVVLAHIDAHCPDGFILDGFPRTVYQAQQLDARHQVDAAIFIAVPESEIVRRLLSRLICPRCGSVFHETAHPPRESGICDRCGSALGRRMDDNEATIMNRIRVYREETMPVLDHYRSSGILHDVEGNGDPDTVFMGILSAITPQS